MIFERDQYDAAILKVIHRDSIMESARQRYDGLPASIREGYLRVLAAQIDDFADQAQAYREAIKRTAWEGGSLRDLSHALIQARVAAGIARRDLASLVGAREEQIVRWEATQYADVALKTVERVAEALGVLVVLIPTKDPTSEPAIALSSSDVPAEPT